MWAKVQDLKHKVAESAVTHIVALPASFCSALRQSPTHRFWCTICTDTLASALACRYVSSLRRLQSSRVEHTYAPESAAKGLESFNGVLYGAESGLFPVREAKSTPSETPSRG